MISFLIDEELIELKDVPPDLTVLDWLRLYQRRTGTKEGCGSGDCGACTVVVVSVSKKTNGHDRLEYKSINSCITLIGALHGKQLLTVESLARGDQLHPVQACMVSEHGSQCGFCTPGFIMSMFSLYQQEEKVDVLKSRVDQALGGNLCRCTGYRPIKQAAFKALDMKERWEVNGTSNKNTESSLTTVSVESFPRWSTISHTEAQGKELIASLNKLNATPALIDGYCQPHTLQALSSYLMEHPDAKILAGGTDLSLEVTQQMKSLSSIVSVNAVPELHIVDVDNECVEIGAAVTLSECMKVLSSLIPDSHELLHRFGSDQIRNQGTIGGNIGSASPIGDLPPMLIALDAELTLQRDDRVRTIMLSDHYLGYKKTSLQTSEFIRSIRIPLPREDSIFAIHKVSKRRDDDISSVCLAIHLPMLNDIVEDARIAFGGMAATPVRAVKAEQALNGRPISDESIEAAQRELSSELIPIGDARASANYRMQVAQNLLRRVYLEAKAS